MALVTLCTEFTDFVCSLMMQIEFMITIITIIIDLNVFPWTHSDVREISENSVSHLLHHVLTCLILCVSFGFLMIQTKFIINIITIIICICFPWTHWCERIK